ncbi:SH3 domain-containing protein [Peribacillus glennii]|uniref:Mannosyl-glycoprotein endo-beta-N-acetylglucosamidase n=1 Tax=Peribacillus glennii TaxID=2303991 RepID=A0A372L8B4_9BACI|nr:SH3 domain-containing protein [Peribacillus glennii]RFU61127.1 mannosyl-glycoprotein endo-beta-N-acetylglucosamidase [Peribacillus glennii]
MKKFIIPGLCFAVLSTGAFEQGVFVAASPAKQVSEKTSVKYVNVSQGSTLNLRKSASDRAAVIGKLSKGTQVTVYSDSNGWSRVKANGKDGYVSSKYLTSTKPGSSSGSSKSAVTKKYVNIKSGSLNLRKSASAKASVIAKLSRGTQVSVYSVSNGWAKISANGKNGYVSSKYLSVAKPGSSSTLKPAAVVKTTTKYVNVSSGSLNLRKTASAKSSLVAKLSKGTRVTVYLISNGWAKISANGKNGYVSSKYLSAAKPGSSSTANPAATVKTTTKYINVSSGSLNMRKSASSKAGIVARLSKGTKVTVYSESKGWSKIKANGKVGYVSSKYLSPSKPGAAKPTTAPNITTKYVNVSSGTLSVRKTASANAPIVTSLSRGVQVTVYSESDGWSKIKANGKEGYVSSEYLSATKPASGNTGEQQVVITKYVNVNTGSTLNMRSAALPTASIVAKLSRGTEVKVYSDTNGWAKVSADGKTGYVSSDFLGEKAPESPGNPAGTVDRVYQDYDLTLNEMTNIQMAAKAQTDKNYQTFIREDGLALTSPTKGTVIGSTWRLRGGAGTNYWVVGTVDENETLDIISTVEGSDGYKWYEVDFEKTWVNASPTDVAYYVNPDNFANHPMESFQFLKLSQTTNLNVAEVNEKILAGKGILSGKAATFIEAGETYGVNEIYLISHALLETGNGASELATGVEINGKTVYNMYGIGAYDDTAVSSGAKYAYEAGWFTPEAAIIGGAQFIARGYINAGQDNLYKMRWNPLGAAANGYATHQYATDIGWASKQVKQIYNLYSLLDSYKMTLEIPKYK